MKAILSACIVGAVALGAGTYLGKTLDQQDANAESECSKKQATSDQIEALLIGLFPNHEVRTVELLDLGKGASASGCVVEVEMLADKNDADTRGFVYVLPGGKHFLNGPLFDKRSKLDIAKTPKIDPAAKAALEENQKKLNELNERLAQLKNLIGDETQPAPATTNAETQAPTQTVPAANDMSEAILAQMQKLPAIKSQGGEGYKDVYVLVDPLCVNCQKLAERSESIARAHGIRWNWLPMYTSEKGWVLSALALKIAQSDESAGEKLLHEVMNPNWDPMPFKDQITGLTEADYGLTKQNLTLFYELSQKNPRLGTPLVVFRRADGNIEIISGLPTDPDWAPLKP